MSAESVCSDGSGQRVRKTAGAPDPTGGAHLTPGWPHGAPSVNTFVSLSPVRCPWGVCLRWQGLAGSLPSECPPHALTSPARRTIRTTAVLTAGRTELASSSAGPWPLGLGHRALPSRGAPSCQTAQRTDTFRHGRSREPWGCSSRGRRQGRVLLGVDPDGSGCWRQTGAGTRSCTCVGRWR